MKKWKLTAVIVLCLFVATATFNRSEVSVYAYTQEEIDAAKAWLSANGYSPTMAGAEQAYQDYLNGKFGPVGGEEAETVPPTEVPPAETVVETQMAEGENEGNNKSVATEATEETTEETDMVESATMAENSSEETESESESVSEISTADMTEENSSEMESTSASEEAGGSLIHVGRYDGIIVVLAIAACAAMGYFTYRYIKKEKKDGE